jgi:hypothetical protein
MSEATILGKIHEMMGGDVNDVSGTILSALEDLQAYIQDLASSAGGGAEYSIGTWFVVGGTGVAYQNGWGAGDSPLQYTKDTNGWVHLRGEANDESATSATIFTLPVGLRPSAPHVGSGFRGGAVVKLTVNTDGTVVVTSSVGVGLNYEVFASFYAG